MMAITTSNSISVKPFLTSVNLRAWQRGSEQVRDGFEKR